MNTVAVFEASATLRKEQNIHEWTTLRANGSLDLNLSYSLYVLVQLR